MTVTTIISDWSETGFEGPEKLLEVWFAPHPTSPGLKAISRDVWESMLDLVQCKVLSVISGDIDAYLLSESSMFVFPHKIILKTCGTTTLLVGLQRLLEIAESVGFTAPWRVFYSRKNYMFPDAQKSPHKTWQDEMNYLDQYVHGTAYQIGPMNGDHWYLYMYSSRKSESAIDDETMEVLMTDIANSKQFYKSSMIGIPKGTEYTALENSEGHVLGSKVAKLSGLKAICCKDEGSVMDSFLFDPLGFSANMVCGQFYSTIHVTPEPEYSYASFETNTHNFEYIPRILDVFRPGKFTVTRFSTSRNAKQVEVEGYTRQDLIFYELDGYFLEFQNWVANNVH